MTTKKIPIHIPYRVLKIVIASAFLLIGLIEFILSDPGWTTFFYIALGLVHGSLLWLEIQNAFILISPEAIERGQYFKISIPVSELTEIKDFAGERIFRADKKEIRVELKHLDEDSRQYLELIPLPNPLQKSNSE